ncbi:unnamed protein product [Ceratitis capitata]|uniref:(Mediterranean fruit fly) hypothetical protein n=1 Tax=Ceratitis capitata TaxID=7213 RepID=A0A811VDH8_CERCA|nr:unnamed protein product [Ceratitis capitata]
MKYGLQTQPQKLVSFAVITIANIKYVSCEPWRMSNFFGNYLPLTGCDFYTPAKRRQSCLTVVCSNACCYVGFFQNLKLISSQNVIYGVVAFY